MSPIKKHGIRRALNDAFWGDSNEKETPRRNDLNPLYLNPLYAWSLQVFSTRLDVGPEYPRPWLGDGSLADIAAQSALRTRSLVHVNDTFGSSLVEQLAKRRKMSSGRIELLGLDSGMQFLNGRFQRGLRSAVASAALERLAKPLLGTLDIWHDNYS